MDDINIAALRRKAEMAEKFANEDLDAPILDGRLRVFAKDLLILLDAAEQLQAVTAERDRLNEDLFTYRREERKILGLPDEATAVDHLDAIQSIKNLRDGWELECKQQNAAKARIITERDSLRTQRDALLAAGQCVVYALLDTPQRKLVSNRLIQRVYDLQATIRAAKETNQ